MPSIELTDELRQKLLAEARAAAAKAYCPYSNFHVGAAILADGKVFTGANVENASYGLTTCAERTAAFAAVLAGHQHFQAVAVCCADVSPEQAREHPESLMPCGACRQLLAEFSDESTIFLVDQAGTYAFNELMPHPFQLRQRT
jgi:cytidine deaminase